VIIGQIIVGLVIVSQMKVGLVIVGQMKVGQMNCRSNDLDPLRRATGLDQI
jgi:hypothetical protein